MNGRFAPEAAVGSRALLTRTDIQPPNPAFIEVSKKPALRWELNEINIFERTLIYRCRIELGLFPNLVLNAREKWLLL
jgi:hypothetical protein